MLDFKTASTIAISIVHSKLDYCNSLFLNLDSTQIQRLQLIQTSLARSVTRTPGVGAATDSMQLLDSRVHSSLVVAHSRVRHETNQFVIFRFWRTFAVFFDSRLKIDN